MGSKITPELPANIFDFFQHDTMTAIASTVDADGFPRGAPMSLFYAPDTATLLMGTQIRSQTFLNVEREGKIALSFLNTGDLAFTVRGTVQVIRNPMEGSPHMGILRVDIDQVKSDVAVDVTVTAGIQYIPRSPKWADFIDRLLAELRRVTPEQLRP